MTPGERKARALALQDDSLVPLRWLTVVQELDTECPPKPMGRLLLDAMPTAPKPPPPVVRHRPRVPLLRRRRDWRQVAVRAAVWTLRAIPPAVVIGLSLLLVRGLLGGL